MGIGGQAQPSSAITGTALGRGLSHQAEKKGNQSKMPTVLLLFRVTTHSEESKELERASILACMTIV